MALRSAVLPIPLAPSNSTIAPPSSRSICINSCLASCLSGTRPTCRDVEPVKNGTNTFYYQSQAAQSATLHIPIMYNESSSAVVMELSSSVEAGKTLIGSLFPFTFILCGASGSVAKIMSLRVAYGITSDHQTQSICHTQIRLLRNAMPIRCCALAPQRLSHHRE